MSHSENRIDSGHISIGLNHRDLPQKQVPSLYAGGKVRLTNQTCRRFLELCGVALGVVTAASGCGGNEQPVQQAAPSRPQTQKAAPAPERDEANDKKGDVVVRELQRRELPQLTPEELAAHEEQSKKNAQLVLDILQTIQREPENSEKLRGLLVQLSENGAFEASMALTTSHAGGDYGMQQNFDDAYSWLQKANEQAVTEKDAQLVRKFLLMMVHEEMKQQ